MKKLSLNLSSFIIIILFSISFSYSDENNITKGKAIVVDGDTIKIKGEQIRFGGIDAPESYYRGKKQTCIKDNKKFFCGQISKDKLIERIGNNSLNCIIEKKKDKYKRNIGTCYLKNKNINKWLVRNGYAIAYKRYSKKYILDEKYAKESKLGIWKGTFIKPEKWRRIMN